MSVPISDDNPQIVPAADARTRRLRVSAYVVCIDGYGRALLARWVGPDGPRWTLPGGGLDYAEHPQVGALRELTEETGYVGTLDALVGVDAEHLVGIRGDDFHAVRIVYRGHVVEGSLTHELDGSTDLAAWVPPDEVPRLDAVSLVGAGLSLSTLPGRPVVPIEATDVAYAAPRPGVLTEQQPRLWTAAVVRDELGAVLLVRPLEGEDRPWRLPGGFVEHGEPFEVALQRTAALEVGVRLAIVELRAVTSEVRGGPTDAPTWQLRFVYDVEVAADSAHLLAPHPEIERSWCATDLLADVPLEPHVREALHA